MKPAVDRPPRCAALWLIGGFVFCPCHLPLTLWLIGSLAAGTALGAAARGHAVWVIVAVCAMWLSATARGLFLLLRGS